MERRFLMHPELGQMGSEKLVWQDHCVELEDHCVQHCKLLLETERRFFVPDLEKHFPNVF